MPPSIRERELADPYSAVTRNERKWVLIINLILFAMVYGRLSPAKISAFGIELKETSLRVLIGLLTAMAYYFLAGFLLYAAADRRAWDAERRDVEAQQLADAKLEQPTLDYEDGHAKWKEDRFAGRSEGRSTYLLRSYFDFWLPVVLGALNPLICFAGAWLI